jgi:hypothetical protein
MGVKNPQWKGDDVGYSGLHKWLRKNYGSADRCENPNCEGKSKKYVYALLRGNKKESHVLKKQS